MEGKVIEVTGTIEEIGKDFTDAVFVRLSSSKQFDFALMYLESTQTHIASTLHHGDQIIIDCEKMRWVMDAPAGYSCIFKSIGKSGDL